MVLKHGVLEPEFEKRGLGYILEITQITGLNERQKKAVLYVKERGKITNKEYREMLE